MPEVSHPSPTTAEDFRRVLDERAIQPLFQPLIDLETCSSTPSRCRSGPAGGALDDVLLACFQEAGHFTPATRSRYEFLATRAAFTGVLGHGMPVAPVAGVRGAHLAADDPLRRERDLVIRAAEPLLRHLVSEP